jgi:hypothetical protein
MIRSSSFLLAAVLLTGGAAQAAVLRVPRDYSTLERALDAARNGDVVELAAGTYPLRSGGLTIRNNQRQLTVRAAAGARVVFDGGGQSALLTFRNQSPRGSKPVVFERLVFQNGAAARDDEAGGVTLIGAHATFVDCSFLGNGTRATTGGGGALRATAGSVVTLRGGELSDNSSSRRGGAIEVRDSHLVLDGVRVLRNRTNLPGHSPTASGGALYVNGSHVVVTNSLFEANEAAWVGGAIYLFGTWQAPAKGPATTLEVRRSTFRANRTGGAPAATSGGAVHAEDHTRVRFHQVAFLDNEANAGGAVSSYRAEVELFASQLRGNRAVPGAGAAAGGAVFLISADFADNSTAGGTINRPPARLTAENTLFDGSGRGPLAQVGGCIDVAGDNPRLRGTGTVPAAGGVAANRAQVRLRRIVLHDCDVAGGSGAPALGGGMRANLVDLQLSDSLVVGSAAGGAEGGGGGIAILGESVATIRGTTFAANSAEQWGGGLFVAGSHLDLAGSSFVANSISPGVSELLTDSRGAALLTIPQLTAGRERNVTGAVSGSTFSANDGIAVWDVDPRLGPINEVRYDGNTFHGSRFGSLVYVDTLAAARGLSAAQLNGLTVLRPGRGGTDKSVVANGAVSAPPRLGALLALPEAGRPGEAPHRPLAFAWSGNSASLSGFGLGSRGGVVPVGVGSYRLDVDGALVATAEAPGVCTGGPYLCLSGNLFVATVDFDSGAVAGQGQARSITADTGTFWFFDPSNVELVTKVVDGRTLNQRFWVFHGGLSNVAYTLRVRDTATGAERVYRNPRGKLASAGDTNAFPVRAGGAAATAAANAAEATSPPPAATVAAAGTCAATPTALCLGGGRFRLTATWRDLRGNSGAGKAVALGGDTGYFWFFGPANVEVVVKVLDGTAINGHFWYFAGALSNVEYAITLTDTVTGASKTYRNPAGQFRSVGDTAALRAR